MLARSCVLIFLSGLLFGPVWCPAASSQPAFQGVAVDTASPENRFEILSVTPNSIRGLLTRGSMGVTFDSRKDDTAARVVIGTLQGRRLISVAELSGQVVAVIDEGRLSASIPTEQLARARSVRSGSAVTAAELQNQLATATQLHGELNAIDDLVHTPEYALLPSVSFELGKLGFTGNRHPASLAIHAAAAAAAQMLGIDPRDSAVQYRYTLPNGLRAEDPQSFEEWLTEVTGKAATHCWDPASGLPNPDARPACPGKCEAFPNRERECYGMCGPGCDRCWEWVCGDCCYHDFCATHDAVINGCANETDALLCVMSLVPWYFIVFGCG
jgi:hypothetical protein